MIAGPNGSGKSTLIARLQTAGIDFGQYLNADDIAHDLAEAAGTQDIAENISRIAQVKVREARAKAIDERRDYSFEMVMSHPSHVDHLLLARSAGFETHVYFVATDDPRINVGRVRNRVLHGGHDVPVDRIEERYHRCLSNLPAAVAAANAGIILDNSSDRSPFRDLARIDDGRLTDIVDDHASPLWWRQVLPALLGR